MPTRFALRALLLTLFGLATACGDTARDTPDEAQFLRLRVEDLSMEGAVLRFETDRMIDAGARFGTSTGALDDEVAADGTYRVVHSIAFAELVPDTTYFVEVMGRDELGVMHRSAMTSFTTIGEDDAEYTIDFIDLRVEETGANRAVVRFDTSVPTSCELEWGLAAGDLPFRAEDPNMADGELALDHEVPLEDLTPDTMHFWRARATDAEGRTFFSEELSFRTLMGEPAPPEGPNVALASAGTTIADRSSNWSNVADDAVWGAANAIDGSMRTAWSSFGDGDDAWILLDLGQERDLSRVGFRSRKMTDGTAIILSFRLVFQDGSIQGPFASVNPDVRHTYDLEPVRSRTVRVEAVETTTGNTGILEVQLYEPLAAE